MKTRSNIISVDRLRNMINFELVDFVKCSSQVELFYFVKRFASFHQVSEKHSINECSIHFLFFKYSSIYHRSNAILEKWISIHEISSNRSTVILFAYSFFTFVCCFFSLALANSKQYENFLPPILSFGFETIYLFHKDNHLASAFKLLKKYRNNLLLIGN